MQQNRAVCIKVCVRAHCAFFLAQIFTVLEFCVLLCMLCTDLRQRTKLMHGIKAEHNVQNIKESECSCEALCIHQILALAALLLLQWECVWITAEMKWPTFSSSRL